MCDAHKCVVWCCEEIHAQWATSCLDMLPDLRVAWRRELGRLMLSLAMRSVNLNRPSFLLLDCPCYSPLPLLLLLSCKGTVYFPRAFCSTREKELFRPRVPQCNAVLQQGRIVAKFPLFGSFRWKDRLCNLAVIQCILQKEKNLTIHIPSWKILPYRVQGYPIAMLERLWYAHPLHDKKPTSYPMPTQTNW